jgi:LysM repeat protein
VVLKAIAMMNVHPRKVLSWFLILSPAPVMGDGLQDLVRPNLEILRERAEQEREAEEKRQRRLEEEEKAKALEEKRRQKKIADAKADPLVDVEDLNLAGGLDGQSSYTVRSGDTLGRIAAERYGSSRYFPVVEDWNGVMAKNIQIGQTIKTPGIATIMRVRGEKVTARYPEEVAAMLKLREDYLALEPQLRNREGELSEEVKAQLDELHQLSKKIHGGFLVKRPGVVNYANSLLAQCRNIVEQFEAMQDGDFGRRNSRISRVHTSLAYAMRNAMVWGREDFK